MLKQWDLVHSYYLSMQFLKFISTLTITYCEYFSLINNKKGKSKECVNHIARKFFSLFYVINILLPMTLIN